MTVDCVTAPSGNCSINDSPSLDFLNSIESQAMKDIIFFMGYGIAIILCAWTIKRISWQSHPFFSDPRSPPFVPYILPFLGSALVFKADPIKFMKDTAKRFKSNIFCAKIGPMNVIFVTDPFAANYLISGRIPQLSWNQTKERILRFGFNLTEEGAKTVANDEEEHGVLDKHLMKTDSLEEIMFKFQNTLRRNILESASMIDKSWCKQNILGFICKFLYATTTESLLGYPSLATDEFYEQSLHFEKNVFYFINQSKRKNQQKQRRIGYEAREKLAQAIRKVLGSHENETKSNKPSFTKDMMNLYESKLSQEDEVHRQVTFFWASYVNALPSTFWLVFNLLSHKDAYEAVKKEVLAIYKERVPSEKSNDTNAKNDGDFNFTLSDMERMVNLESVLLETFRLTTTYKAFRFRHSDEDFEIKLNVDNEVQKFFVKKGTVFMMSTTLDHRDEEVFKDAMEFKWDRFVPGPDGRPPVFTKNGRRLLRPVNPFGGGPSICPGRRFAMAEIKTLVASLLLRYDFRFVDDKIPEAPEMHQTSAVSSTAFPANDVSIEMKKADQVSA